MSYAPRLVSSICCPGDSVNTRTRTQARKHTNTTPRTRQIVLEANRRNVARGSRVYELGHYLVLGWCASQRDLEVVAKVVEQVGEGGGAGGAHGA